MGAIIRAGAITGTNTVIENTRSMHCVIDAIKDIIVNLELLCSEYSMLFCAVLNRYIYVEETELTGYNVLSTLYCAKKYMIPGLEATCRQYLEQQIDHNNVCFILEQVSPPFSVVMVTNLNSQFFGDRVSQEVTGTP